MEKVWQVLPKIESDFISKNPEYNQVILQLLFNRGIKTPEEIKAFFNDNYDDLADPFSFNDMKPAVELIIKHVKEQNKIVIYGDYDADGVTAAALLVEVLKILKAKVDVYIPDRAREGYGLNEKAILSIANQGVKLIITVDQGIRDKEEVARAKDLGLDVIITDHHIAPSKKEDLPDCPVINPNVLSEKYFFKFLSGAGVALQLARAIIQKSKLGENDKQLLEDGLLDLVAIGTVADCVSLMGENRLLVKTGLEVLNKTKRLGLRKLIKVAQIDKRELEAWNIGFQIGPRLNAAGRLKSANTAFELLITKDEKAAQDLASQLDVGNKTRQTITKEIMGEIAKQVASQKDQKIIIGVCPIDEDKSSTVWNEGVIGLVAGRIADKYYKPVLVITKSEDGYKGSGRSIPEFNIIAAVEDCSDFLTKYGGHPAACGFSLEPMKLEKFKNKMQSLAKAELADKKLQPKLAIDCELNLEEIDENLVNDIAKLAPFGQNNPQPKFISEEVRIKDIMTMGVDGQHIKFRFNGFWALAFSRADDWKDFKIGDVVDIVYYLEENEFNGNREIQLKLVDIRECDS